MASLHPSTWNSLGFGVATTWVGLGIISICQPVRTARLFGVSPHLADTKEINHAAMGFLVGTRDLTIAATLFILGRAGLDQEMGSVILSSMIICVTDIFLSAKAKRYSE